MKKFKHYFGLTAAAILICVSLTACGSGKKGSTSGNNNTDNNNSSELAEGMENAVNDIANEVTNVVDDLVGSSGFKDYASAHDYFMDTMGAYHSDAKFEIRDEDRSLNDYQEGSKGYHFKLYDTSKIADGELFGEFFVDANSGMIYKRDTDGSIIEYPAKKNDTNANNSGSGMNVSNN